MSNADSHDRAAPRAAATVKPSANSPLVSYVLGGLQKSWMPAHQRWSHVYHLDGRPSPSQSIPQSDVLHSLNVLLGLSRIRAVPPDIDLADVFFTNADQLTRLPMPKYALGMAMWTAARLKLDLPFGVAKMIRQLLEDRSSWTTFRAHDLGMLLTGVVAQASVGRTEFAHHAAPLSDYLSESFATETGLFCDSATGYRRRFSTFAAQIHLAIASYSYGEYAGDPAMIYLGNACARRLIELQGPHGEWPCLLDAERGSVVDFYDVQSVHQFGMAPALLEFSERHDVEGASAALVRGFTWIFGENQLRRSMLVPSLQMIHHSQTRHNSMWAKGRQRILAMAGVHLHREAQLAEPSKIAIRMECRSHELSWILWSFGARRDLPELTHNLAFRATLR
jgi:hypothetical protein